MSNDPADLDPRDAMAVDSTPDETRLHGEPDETEAAELSDGSRAHLDPGDDAGS